MIMKTDRLPLIFLIALLLGALLPCALAAEIDPVKHITYSEPSPKIKEVKVGASGISVVTDRGRVTFLFSMRDQLRRPTVLAQSQELKKNEAYKFKYILDDILQVRDENLIDFTIQSDFDLSNLGCYNTTDYTGELEVECDTGFRAGDLDIDFFDFVESGFVVNQSPQQSLDNRDNPREQSFVVMIPRERILGRGVVLDPITYAAPTITITSQNATLLDINNSIADCTKFCCYPSNDNFRYPCDSPSKIVVTDGGNLTLDNDQLNFTFAVNTAEGLVVDNGGLYVLNKSEIRGETKFTQIIVEDDSRYNFDSSFFKMFGYGSGIKRNGLLLMADGGRVVNCSFFDTAKWMVSLSYYDIDFPSGISTNVLFANNTIDVDNGIRGLGLFGSQKCNVSNNSITDFTGQGIQITRKKTLADPPTYISPKDLIIKDNYIDGETQGQHGIKSYECEFCDNIWIHNNTLRRLNKPLSDAGIYLDGGTHYNYKQHSL